MADGTLREMGCEALHMVWVFVIYQLNLAFAQVIVLITG